MKWLLTFVVAGAVLVQSGLPADQLPPAHSIPPEERLWLVQISNGAGNPFPEEVVQIKKACGDSFNGLTAEVYFACSAKFIKPARYPIAQLHAAPIENSAVVATLFEDRTVGPNNRPHMVWTLETASRPGQRVPWPGYGEAFDYGLHIPGAHRKGEWVRLLTSIPVDGWLRIPRDAEPAPIQVHVSGLQREVVNLLNLSSSLWAVGPDGNPREIAEGSYFVKGVSKSGIIEFRKEIPSDFDCRVHPVIDPVPLPPTFQAHAAEFFNPNGTPRFSTKYWKGC